MTETTPAGPDTARPKVELNSITGTDIIEALKAGIADMARAPALSLFFGAVFSGLGVLISYLLIIHASSYWVLPIAAGFPLVGPFAAVGLYEISRRIETGEPLGWGVVLGAVVRQGRLQLASYAFVTLFIFLIWVYLAHLIFALSFGLKPLTNVMSSSELLFTATGLTMLTAGTIVGGAISAFLFSISVTAVPMLLDRDIDVVTAMVHSVRSVLRNQGAMLLWGAIIAVLSVLAMAPLFIGMILVFPVLGHASWHVYRRAVAPA